MAKSKKIPLYWVEWWDAFDPQNRWYEVEKDLPQTCEGGFLCVTVGFLVSETKDYIILAQTLGNGATKALSPLNIPRGCIKRKLKIGRLDV